MLIDPHAHTSGISRCCRIPAPEVIEHAKSVGLGGIILTNHYQKSYLENDDAAAFAAAYVKEYEYAKACGDEAGFAVYFGVELTMDFDTRLHMLIYGVEPSFVLENPRIFELSLPELSHLIHENGGILVQGHPYRGGATPQDPRYLDGIEVNCHPIYKNSHEDDVTEIAMEHNLILTSGGDYHADTYRPHCGVYIPDDLPDGIAVAEYMKTTPTLRILVQECDAPDWHEVEHTRTV
ncbi:MAG: hypothetical protein IJB51_02710 [Clostridia bacterium]|nr:hypothetical protein [Clostridia bacterium]